MGLENLKRYDDGLDQEITRDASMAAQEICDLHNAALGAAVQAIDDSRARHEAITSHQQAQAEILAFYPEELRGPIMADVDKLIG